MQVAWSRLALVQSLLPSLLLWLVALLLLLLPLLLLLLQLLVLQSLVAGLERWMLPVPPALSPSRALACGFRSPAAPKMLAAHIWQL